MALNRADRKKVLGAPRIGSGQIEAERSARGFRLWGCRVGLQAFAFGLFRQMARPSRSMDSVRSLGAGSVLLIFFFFLPAQYANLAIGTGLGTR